LEQSYGLCYILVQENKGFPNDELYSLTNQMRRAAVTIPSNIAEGVSRQSNKEYIQFLYIARITSFDSRN